MNCCKRWTQFFFGGHAIERCKPGGKDNKGFRSHLAWSKRRNVNLKEVTTSRCLKSTVIVALMIRTNTAILFSNSEVGHEIRAALKEDDRGSIYYWIGVTCCVSLFVSVFALIANYTAFSIFNSLSAQNAPIVLRSSVGRYASELASNLVTGSLFTLFLVAYLSYVGIGNPGPVHSIVALCIVLFFFHSLHTLHAIGHTIINTGAMGHDPILPEEDEEGMDEIQLSDCLLKKMKVALKANVPINYQYMIPYQSLLKKVERGTEDVPLEMSRLDELRENTDTKKWHRS